MTGHPTTPTGQHPKYNLTYIWLISLTAAMGGLLFGYDWVVIGGAKPFFERYFELTDAAQKGWANSCALIGCLVGAVTAGALSDSFGRKRLLIFSALLFAVTSLGIGLSDTFFVFVVWRIMGGVAIGLASNLSPMYIAEIAPANMRGRLVSLNQITIVIGILAAQLINYVIAERIPPGMTEEALAATWNCQEGWRWMFAATAVPSLVFLVSMIFVPESPRWLVKNGREGVARSIVAKVGGEEYADAAMAEIRATLVNDIQKVDFRELLDPKMRRVLVLGVTLAVFQQWCGINVIFNYAEEVFSAAGRHLEHSSQYCVDGLRQSCLYVCGARSCRQRRAADSHAAGCGCTCDHLHRSWSWILNRFAGATNALAGACRNGNVRDVARSHYLGRDL